MEGWHRAYGMPPYTDAHTNTQTEHNEALTQLFSLVFAKLYLQITIMQMQLYLYVCVTANMST